MGPYPNVLDGAGVHSFIRVGRDMPSIVAASVLVEQVFHRNNYGTGRVFGSVSDLSALLRVRLRVTVTSPRRGLQGVAESLDIVRQDLWHRFHSN